MLTQWGIEEDGREQEHSRVDVGSAGGENLGRRAEATGAIFAGEVEEVLVGGDGGEEVGRAGEVFEIEELGLDGGVAAFDIGIGIGTCGGIEAMPGARGGDAAVEAVRAVVDGVAIELAAQVSAHFEVRQSDAVRFEVREDAGLGECGVGF